MAEPTISADCPRCHGSGVVEACPDSEDGPELGPLDWGRAGLAEAEEAAEPAGEHP